MDKLKTLKKTNSITKNISQTKSLSKVGSVNKIEFERRKKSINFQGNKKFATTKILTDISNSVQKPIKPLKPLTINTGSGKNVLSDEKVKSKFGSKTPRCKESLIITPTSNLNRRFSQIASEELNENSSQIKRIIEKMSNLIKMNSKVELMQELDNSFDLKHTILKLDMIYYEMDNLYSDAQELYEKNKRETMNRIVTLSQSSEFNSTQSTAADSFYTIDPISAIASEKRISIYNQCFQLCSGYMNDVINMIKDSLPAVKEKSQSPFDSSAELNNSVSSFKSEDMFDGKHMYNTSVLVIDHDEEEDSIWNISQNTSSLQEEVHINIPHSTISHVKKPADPVSNHKKNFAKVINLNLDKINSKVSKTIQISKNLNRNSNKAKTLQEIKKPKINYKSNYSPEINQTNQNDKCLLF